MGDTLDGVPENRLLAQSSLLKLLISCPSFEWLRGKAERVFLLRMVENPEPGPLANALA